MADLRPMEFGEILDGALTLFRRHFRLFFKLSLTVMWLPLGVLMYWKLRFLGMGVGDRPDAMLAMLQSQIVPIMIWGLLLFILYEAAQLLLTAGSIRIISDSYLGREPKFADALTLGSRKILPLFLVGLGKGLLLGLVGIVCVVVITMIGAVGKSMGTGLMVLLVLAGTCLAFWFLLFIACGYMVTTPTVVLETLSSAFDSFGRSWELTRGAKLRMLGLWLVALLIVGVLPAIVVQAVGAMLLQIIPGAQIPWAIVSTIVPVMLAPIIPCILTLAYYDLRVKREGFDLQLLSEQLEAS